MNKIQIKYNEDEEMLEIKKGKKVIFYGSFWDFPGSPTAIKEFLINCGLEVTMSEKLKSIE